VKYAEAAPSAPEFPTPLFKLTLPLLVAAAAALAGLADRPLGSTDRQ
jgi:hypothetical protein